MKKKCIICSRDVPHPKDNFCCQGCSAVYSIVSKLELTGAARDERIKMLLEGVFPGGEDIESCLKEIENSEKLDLYVDGMVCPACAWLIHNRLSKIEGISKLNVNFISEVCEIYFDPMKLGFDDLENAVSTLGYQIRKNSKELKNIDLFKFGAGWFMTLNCMMISFVVYSSEVWDVPNSMKWLCSFILLVFGTLVPLYAAIKTIKMGFYQLSNFSFRMESLIVLSTFAAWIYSVVALTIGDFQKLYFDVVALLLMLIETGNLITNSFYRKLYNRVNSLSLNLPKKVRLKDENFRKLDELKPGNIFKIYQNETVPTDGILLKKSEFDFSLISGESSGIWLEKGQFIGAGSKLLSLETNLMIPPSGQSNLMESIVNNTIEAFNSKRETISFGDKISQYFVPVVIFISLIVFILNTLNGCFEEGFYRLLSILIVACPCAFGIAEPLVLTFGIDKMRRIGIQCYNGGILSLKPSKIIFDKTGTLTKGKPEVVKIKWLVDKNQKLLNILASMEYGIDHPVAKACTKLGNHFAINKREIFNDKVEVIIDEKKYIAGNYKTYPDIMIPKEFDKDTIVLFGDENKCYAIIGLRDTIREDSHSVIAFFKKLNIQTLIFSGDRTEVVDDIGKILEVNKAYGEMSCSDKKIEIQKLQKNGNTIMMVGDGINDSQALAAADLGLSVYTAESSAKMSSDGVLLQPGINSLTKFMEIMKKVRLKIKANYNWAFAYNIIGIGLASFGLLSPKFCAIGMVFSNLVVLINSSIWKKSN